MCNQRCVYLEVGCEGVREPHVAWEGTEDEVAELDAVGRDDVTEAVVVVTQELWEVVQEDQENSQRALEAEHNHQITRANRLFQVWVAKPNKKTLHIHKNRVPVLLPCYRNVPINVTHALLWEVH